MATKEVTITILVDEKLKKDFDDKCGDSHRSMASQIRYFMELWVADKLNIREGD